jgi:hypothetical protein
MQICFSALCSFDVFCEDSDVVKRDDSNRLIETAELKEGLLDPKFLSGSFAAIF